MPWLWLAVAVVALYALHRVALWAEDRGWIFYTRKRASSGTLGNALMDLQSIVQPSVRHTLEIRRNKKTKRDNSGQGSAGDDE